MKMTKIWTSLTTKAWDILQKEQCLRADIVPDLNQYFEKPFNWMIKQMVKRGMPRPSPITMPLWGWYQWQGIKHKKPDLRYKGLGTKDETMVLVECNIDKTRLLFSDYAAWHFVLNNWYLCSSEEDDNNFEKLKLSKKKRQNIITSSWERIFDFENPVDNYVRHEKDKAAIQVCFWELFEKDIVKYKFFVAR